MFSFIKIPLGIFFCFIGFCYLFRPAILERIKVFIRDTLLNDSYIALERKKWGTFFLLIGFLLLYMGMD